MKNKHLNTLLLMVLTLVMSTSCEDYLAKTPDATAFTEDEVFESYEKSQQFIDQLLIKDNWDVDPWTDLAWAAMKKNGLPLQLNGSRDRISDDCLTGVFTAGEKMWQIRRGNFLATEKDQDFRWQPNNYRRFDVKWRAIRIACMSITNIDRMLDGSEEDKARILGLAYFMKGHFYFQIVQNWGGMPWLDEPLDPYADFDLPRDDYATSMQKIAETFEKAALYCPDVVDPSDWGRPSKVAALAYKAKALTFAASPFANPTNDQKMWEEAAIAAGEALVAAEQGGYYLVPLSKWRNLFHGCDNETFNEVLYGILHKNKQWKKGQPQWHYSGIRSKPFGSGAKAESVTENLAQCFTWSNGDIIDPTTEEYKKTPYTGDGVNHQGRDPRFDLSLVYNGQENPMTRRQGRNVEIWNTSFNGKVAAELLTNAQGVPTAGYTITGYYNWKLKADANYRNNARSDQMFNYIRLADVYLYYAEAANRAWGPTAAPVGISGFSKSAVEVLNELRTRANMPKYDNSTPSLTIGDTEQFEQKIRNESRVETAFEGKRFYNLRRWRLMTDPDILLQTGMHIEQVADGEFEYTIVPLSEQRQLVWQEQHYLFPIPNSNIFLGPNFKQNPGW